jgi:hypothetical protein
MSADLPEYQCQKVVRAAPITSFSTQPVQTLSGDPSHIIQIDVDGERMNVAQSAEFIAEHGPEVGDYYVVAGNGAASVLPKEAFEREYVRIPDPPPITVAKAATIDAKATIGDPAA